MACHEGQAQQSKLQFEEALSVYKQSALTFQTSGFCSKFFSAHAKQLAKRETHVSGRSKYDPEYPARQGTGRNQEANNSLPRPQHGRKFIFLF